MNMNLNFSESNPPACRVCCDVNNLMPLFETENKSIVKKLRACADIIIEQNDALPQFVCYVCSERLVSAYNFKIQCEFMDRKLREFATNKIDEMSIIEDVATVHEDNDGIEHMDDGSREECVDEIMYLEPAEEIEYLNDDGIEMENETIDDQSQGMKNVELHTSSVEIPMKLRKASAFKCETCSVVFVNYREYNLHKKSHGKPRYQCLTCERWFEKLYLLTSHQKTHSGNKSFACGMCSKRYTNQGNLKRHIRVAHNKERQYTCNICNKGFTRASVLREHHSVHVTQREFNCDICKKAFKTESYLKLHKLRHLPVEQRPKRKYKPTSKKYKPPPKVCVCLECGKESTNSALHRIHMQTHSNEKKYKCRYCQKRFSFQQTLRNHICLHTGEKKFKCDLCDMSFRQIGHLQGHKLIHTGEKAHSCSICGKSFALRSNLTVHMRTHSNPDDLPYQCNICSRKFRDPHGLKRHEAVHKRNEKNIC